MDEKTSQFVVSENQISDDFMNGVRWVITESDDVLMKHLMTHPTFSDVECLKQLVWALREQIKSIAGEQCLELESLARPSDTSKELAIMDMGTLRSEHRKARLRLQYLEDRHVAWKKFDATSKEEITELEIQIEDLDLELEYVKKERDDTKAELQRMLPKQRGTLDTNENNGRL